MKKRFFLSMMLPWLGLWGFAQKEDTTTALESLDFTVNDITYTILDENAKTCQTKSGYSYIDYTTRSIKVNYGNDINTDVTIPSTVAKDETDIYNVVAIGSYSFGNATSVTIEGSNLTTIGTGAFFENDKLTSVNIPESVTSIESLAFAACENLSSISLPSGLTSISKSLFLSCTGLKTIKIPDNVAFIEDFAFSSCTGLTEVVIPDNVMQIGASSFANCSSLVSLTLSESLTTIPASAFSGCNNLLSITIPSNVNSIGANGFNCSGLKEIVSESKTPPAISANSFNAANYSNATLWVYKTAFDNYEKSTLWNNFTNKEIIEVNPTGITVTPSILNINLGLTGEVLAELTPEDATGEISMSITSMSSDDMITLQNGVVTGKKTGNAVITATCGSLTATCEVVVSANPDEYIVIDPLDQNLRIGDTAVMTATVYPTTITPEISWMSSNPEIATIDNTTGLIAAIAPGGTVITAIANDVSASLALTVYPIEAESVTINQTSAKLKVGESVTLTAKVSPDNVTYPEVMWETSDPNIAVVSNGVVTAMGVGLANIKASCGGYTANCEITVDPVMASQIELSISNETLKIGQSLQINATISPDNTTDKTVTWVSSDENVATVSINGEVLALSQGETTITATCGDVEATCTIKVVPVDSEDIILNYTAVNVKIGQTLQLSATIYPEDTTDKTVIWTSSDETVAVVNNGLVSVLKEGTATISATNGSQSASCIITAEPVLAEQVILTQSNITVNVGTPVSLTSTVLPDNTTDPTIVWTSLNPEVVTVAGGVVTGLIPGTTVVTATCGAATASCIVTVVQPATSITLNETELTLNIGEMYDLIETVKPADTTDAVVWTSSNVSIVIVDENGIVTALQKGSATITATCGSVNATCNVVVLDKDSSAINEFGDKYQENVYKVYTTDGLNVLSTEDASELSNLKAGIYIINGKKIIIK